MVKKSSTTAFRESVVRPEARIAELEKRLGKNRSNSSKPPSTDGLKRRTSSLRNNSSGRKPGGQPGHQGQRLRPDANPDRVIDLPLTHCPQCQRDISNQPAQSVEERQVFELPPIKLLVTAYRAERKSCPVHGAIDRRGEMEPAFDTITPPLVGRKVAHRTAARGPMDIEPMTQPESAIVTTPFGCTCERDGWLSTTTNLFHSRF